MWRLRGTSELAGTSLVEKLSKFGTGATFDHVARHEAVEANVFPAFVCSRGLVQPVNTQFVYLPRPRMGRGAQVELESLQGYFDRNFSDEELVEFCGLVDEKDEVEFLMRFHLQIVRKHLDLGSCGSLGIRKDPHFQRLVLDTDRIFLKYEAD